MPVKPKDLKDHAEHDKPVKSAKKKPPDISLDDAIKQFMALHKAEHDAMEKLPRKFTRNDGVHEVHPDKKDKDLE